MIISVILPFIAFLLLYEIIYSFTEYTSGYTRIRIAILKSGLLASMYVVAATELLSYFQMIHFTGIVFIWSAAVLILTAIILILKLRFIGSISLFLKLWELIKFNIEFRLIVFFIFASLIISLIYPANNYDSLTYHMGRVAHWIQNQNIQNYSTHVFRQVTYPPFAEWIILHLQILVRGDVLANTSQLFFFIGCIITATLIAVELGGNKKQQFLTALFVALVPMAVIQSNTTQNDVVVAFYVSSFCYFTLLSYKKVTFSSSLFAGLSLGLAWLTKGTGYIFTFLFCLWFVGIFLREIYHGGKVKIRISALSIVMIPVVALLLNAGFYSRNIEMTGSPLGKANEGTSNERHSVINLFFVGIKSGLNHAPYNYKLKPIVAEIASYCNVDINDPLYSTNDISLMHEGMTFHEDYAQNFIQVFLFISLCLIWLLRRRFFHESNIKIYSLFILTVIGSILMFIILLKWQPWSNRLQTPLFVLSSIICALEISNLNRVIRYVIILPMIGFGFGALLWSQNHRIMPPTKSIFFRSYNSFLYEDEYIHAAQFIDSVGFKNIGLYISADSKDYLFYRLLMNDNYPERKIEHVLVQNQSSVFEKNFTPDVILSLYGTPLSLELNGKTYLRREQFTTGVALFRPE